MRTTQTIVPVGQQTEGWGAALSGLVGANRRFDLTGLEEAEELWDRLNDATSQLHVLQAGNTKLTARVRYLERQLSEVGGLSDDDLVAELPRRMARALETAQGVANEVVRRANRQKALILQQATVAAADVRRQAEMEAAELRERAAADGAAHRAAAEVDAAKLLAEANGRREKLLAEFRERSAVYRRQIGVLEEHHGRLIQAYAVVERTLAEARGALLSPPVTDRRPGAGADTRAVALELAPTDRGEGGGEGVGTVARPRLATGRPPVRPPTVYDWSPAESDAG